MNIFLQLNVKNDRINIALCDKIKWRHTNSKTQSQSQLQRLIKQNNHTQSQRLIKQNNYTQLQRLIKQNNHTQRKMHTITNINIKDKTNTNYFAD
ncbi:MAG: hypothetical protein RR416_02945 [Clostridia bacterium]